MKQKIQKNIDVEAWFSLMSAEDFFDMAKIAKEKDILEGKERKFLYNMGDNLRKNRDISTRQKEYAKRIVNEFEHYNSKPPDPPRIKRKGKTHSTATSSLPPKHLTLRMAWHDNKWNGHICKNPTENIYCVGEYSLLSNRLKQNRKLDKEIPGSPVNQLSATEYVPPCFWSINAFGRNDFDIFHVNPVLSKLNPIKETLPKCSLFSWNFKLSFVRGKEQLNKYGKYYPEDKFSNRLENFLNKFKPNKSIVFFYTNYDNPISGDEYNIMYPKIWTVV